MLSVAKLGLADFEKLERQSAETHTNVTRGKLTFGDALEIYRQRINGAVTLKQRSKNYCADRITALRNRRTNLLGGAPAYTQRFAGGGVSGSLRLPRRALAPLLCAGFARRSFQAPCLNPAGPP